MVITKVKIGDVQYRIFEDVVLFPGTKNEVSVNVAEQALDDCIMQKIESEEYHEVRGVDETYGYVVPQEIADSENEDDIRESIEDVYDVDEFVGVTEISLSAPQTHKFILKETEKIDPDYCHKEEFNTLEEAQKRMGVMYRDATGEYQDPTIEKTEFNERSALVVLNDGNEIEWDIEEIEI